MQRRSRHRRSWRRLGAALTVTLVVAACSSGSSGNQTTTATTPRTGTPTSIGQWEDLWETERAEAVKRILDNGWGWDQGANKVTGPGGFEVDLGACPAGWDPYGGLDGGVIRLGQILDQSGPSVADGVSQQLYYDHINRQGGLTDAAGRTYTIATDIRDDDADTGKTQPIVDELLASDTFTIQTAGSATTGHVYDRINASCVPDPVVASGLPAWHDPERSPWVWGQQLAHNTEALLWGALIERRFADRDGVTVGALVMQTSVGTAFEAAFTSLVETSAVTIDLEVAAIEPTALQQTLTMQMATLASRDLDVFIAMVAGPLCTQVIAEAASAGLKESADMLILPSTCRTERLVGDEAVGGDGSASTGWWVAGGGVKDLTDPAVADDPWVVFARDLLAGSGHTLDGSPWLGTALRDAWPLVEALKIAAELPGGISRPNLLVAARTMAMTNPTLLDGVSYTMSGNDDAYLIEGSELAVYDASSHRWVSQEDVGIIDLNGTSPSCAWDNITGTCA